ncbi:hypothetical protein H0H92_000091 [Tricholoma furcatifolium]|nr:hypothetical protein H0H92_000091 [Tricholoma furcatifolium]
MLAFKLILTAFLAHAACATPLPDEVEALKVPPANPNDLLCQLPILKKILCPRSGNSSLSVETSLGLALGTPDVSGVRRFIVKYANANRWAHSSVVTEWNLPTGASNQTSLPLACPQPDVDSSTYNEDCLSMILYVPPTLSVGDDVPTLMWIHGGSFIVGSATGPGLDGSNLALATNSIVAVVQYRLGALGFSAPDGVTNLALKDIVNALEFLNIVVPSFGGAASKITVAGQSSGANMIRALLADYGFLSATTQQNLQCYFNGLISCDATNISCWDALSLDTILDAQTTFFNNAAGIDASAGLAEPIRPVNDGYFITSPLDSTAPFPAVSKPIMITNVLDEAALTIYGEFTDPLPSSYFEPICNATFGPDRTAIVVDSPYYPTPSSDTDVRVQLQTLGTDYIWKCAGWTFARNWVHNGGTAYVGQYLLGASYAGNDAVPYCTEEGVVCHQDDIEIVFGTVANATDAQAALVAEMQLRYQSFMTTGSPNANGLSTWTTSTTSGVNAQPLGGAGPIVVGACDPSFWGDAVDYDYQVYDI